MRSTKTILKSPLYKRRVQKLEQIGDILVFKRTNETAPVSGILRGANWTFSVSELKKSTTLKTTINFTNDKDQPIIAKKISIKEPLTFLGQTLES